MRQRQGYSQKQLADIMECTENYIWRLEHGKRYPSKEFLLLLGYRVILSPEESDWLALFVQMARWGLTTIPIDDHNEDRGQHQWIQNPHR